MQRTAGEAGSAARTSRPSNRTIAGVLLGVLVILFIVLNRDSTDISFIVFTAHTALWIALTVAALGGFVAGLLIGRHRYRT